MHPQSFDINSQEQERLKALIEIIPKDLQTYLDVGTRHGHLPLCLVDHFKELTVVDLVTPNIDHPKIKAESGDIRKLVFPNESFDVVTCTEVLEHIPPEDLATACSELARVTKKYLVIGVPYKQDLRVGRSRCQACGKINPPWGHVNSFDEEQITGFFSGFALTKKTYHGKDEDITNFFSSWLIVLSNYMYGARGSDGHCIFCRSAIMPPNKNFFRAACAKTSIKINDIYRLFLKDKWIWMHMLFERQI